MSFSDREILEPVKSTLIKKGWHFETEVKTHLDGPKKVGVGVVLYMQSNVPIAVIEFKTGNSLQKGIEQAKRYAQPLNVMYTFATDGHQLFFHEQIGELEIKSKLRLNDFPTKDFLWQLYCSYHKYDIRQQDLIAHPYYNISETQPRNYQVEAISSATMTIVKGQQSMLMVLAQGTGKNYVTLQIVWRLIQSNFSNRVLILFDRQDQLIQASVSYRQAFGHSLSIVKGKKIEYGHSVYLGMYQALMATELGEIQKVFQQIDNDYFDVIIADECHRCVSQHSAWYEVLNYFSRAIKIGITPTPILETIDYFGSLIFHYDIAQSIEDGNATSARLIQIKKADEFRKVLNSKRIDFVAQQITTYLQTNDPMAKTIVFCHNVKYAEYMRERLVRLNPEEVERDARYITKFTHKDESNHNALRDFKDPNSAYPVIAITVNMLAKGIDVPTCKLIVIDREIESSTLILQMIVRGNRNIKGHDKSEFTVLDFSNSTKRYEKELSGIIKETICLDSTEELAPTAKNPLSFNEAKVVVLGDRGAGKTTLINQLENKTHSITQGITYKINNKIDDYQLNILEYQSSNQIHSISELFITPNTLYLYVIDQQNINLINRIDYWLNLIKAKAANAPILIVINIKDFALKIQHDIDKFKEDFNIVDIIDISLANRERNETLRTTIIKSIQTLPTIKTSYPASWHPVKQELFALDEPNIFTINFEKVCKSHGISDLDEMQRLLTELNYLGQFIFYQQRDVLNNVSLFYPQMAEVWLKQVQEAFDNSTNGLILRDEFLALSLDNFSAINNDLLIRLLSEYKLVFELNNSTLICPFLLSLLPVNFDITPYQQGINYRFKYQFITPISIVCKIVIALQSFVILEKESIFQQTVFVTFGGATALIQIDEVNRNIDIGVNTSNQNAKELLAIVVNGLREINGANTEVTEQIALPLNNTNNYETHLLRTTNTKQKSKAIDRATNNLPSQLLADFEQWEYQLLLKIHSQLEQNPVIEIQQQLPDLKKEFTGFKVPLSEFIADCDDGQIVNADIAIVHAQLASKNLNYLCGNESICSKLTHHFAHNRNNSQFFITQFNQIVENYSLPKALLLDEI